MWLAIREDARCWPVGIVNVALYFFVFFHARLYATAWLQAVYVALSIYGWRQWVRGGESGGRLAISSTPRGWTVGLAAAGVLASIGLGLFLKLRTDAALPFPDAATTAASLVAQWMTTRKWVESWLVWIAVDVVYLGVYASQGLYLSTGLYAAFLVMAALGYRRWRASMKEGPETATTASAPREGASRRADRPGVHGKDLAGGRAGRALRRRVGSRVRARVRGGARRGPQLRGRRPDRAGTASRGGRGDRGGRDPRRGPRGPRHRPRQHAVYGRHYYDDCPPWVEEEAKRRLGDLYLLHHVDVAWVADGRQREQPERREELFARFEATLRGLGARVADVAGPWASRREGAVRAIDALVAERRPAGG